MFYVFSFFFSHIGREACTSLIFYGERERVVYLYEKKIKRRDKNNILLGFRNGET